MEFWWYYRKTIRKICYKYHYLGNYSWGALYFEVCKNCIVTLSDLSIFLILILTIVRSSYTKRGRIFLRAKAKTLKSSYSILCRYNNYIFNKYIVCMLCITLASAKNTISTRRSLIRSTVSLIIDTHIIKRKIVQNWWNIQEFPFIGFSSTR